MSAPQLGRLEVVHPREVWPHEAQSFTPWLLVNVDVLNTLLGMDLELAEAEHPVGDFSLDLRGSDLSDDSVVIIENQLEQSDHGHLGQILTYAAGTDPRTIVWITAGFRPEHRAALDWLNEHTLPDVRFFGIEIEVVRIGTSSPAPNFKVVVKPNDWGKRVKAATASSVSGKSALYFQFWEQFLGRVAADHPTWTKAKAPVGSSFYDLPTGLSTIVYSTAFAMTGLRVQLYFRSPKPELNQANFERVLEQKDAFEAALGVEPQWDAKPGKKAAAIFIPSPFQTVEATDQWPEMIDWILLHQSRFRDAFAVVGGASAFR